MKANTVKKRKSKPREQAVALAAKMYPSPCCISERKQVFAIFMKGYRAAKRTLLE